MKNSSSKIPDTGLIPGTCKFEIPVNGMDCAECAQHVQHAIASLPGVSDVQVYLAAEKAVFYAASLEATLPQVRQAVAEAGYSVPENITLFEKPGGKPASLSKPLLTLLGVVFGAVLFIVVIGEWLGLFEKLGAYIPWYVGLAAVLLGGWPVLLNVGRATLKRQVTSHTLMTMGVIAAALVGEWITAVLVVFFMRVGDYTEHFTTERARQAVRDLTRLAPRTARLQREGAEVEVLVDAVRPGDTVIVRPGEQIPVDGEVISGHAALNQAAITGESMPVDAGPGSRVFAATLAQGGSLQIRATAVGRDSTFGRVIQMVEEAEAHRAPIQRIADRFSAWYLPVVAGIALLTLLLRGDPLAAAAVTVVACSCSFALATPIAMLASIGAGAQQGLLIKGGKYLETLARADVLLVDKTGTLTPGKPQIQEVLVLDNALTENDLLQLAASAERYSEHPLAGAVREAAHTRGIALLEPEDFNALPGLGVTARVNGALIQVGSGRWTAHDAQDNVPLPSDVQALEAQGKTLIHVLKGGQPVGLLAAADTLRPEVPQAFAELRALGLRHILLLTGDNEKTAAALAGPLGLEYRANLLPEEKIELVRQYQQQGHVVVMVGDGVNDAPALAQADVGIAMGAAGSDIAIEAAHIALLREDWLLIPQALRIARRTMSVVKSNLIFTVVYNTLGLTLAALGILPPALAAAAQSLPDLGILANSSRLLRQK